MAALLSKISETYLSSFADSTFAFEFMSIAWILRFVVATFDRDYWI